MVRQGLLSCPALVAALAATPLRAAEDVIDTRETASEPAIPLLATPMAASAATRERASSGGGAWGTSYFAGVSATGTNAFVLRITNRGPRAGTATVTLATASTGALLGTWTSGSIPVFGAIQKTIASIAAAVTPALTPAQLAAPMNFSVSTTFAPATQLLTFHSTTGAVSNLTACGANLFEDIYLLGHMEGPNTAGMSSAVRLFNGSGRTLAAHLTIYDVGGGAQMGAWNSQDIPSGASITMSTSAILAAATPAIPATTAAVTVLATPVRGLRLEHVVMAGGALTDLTSACSP